MKDCKYSKFNAQTSTHAHTFAIEGSGKNNRIFLNNDNNDYST